MPCMCCICGITQSDINNLYQPVGPSAGQTAVPLIPQGFSNTGPGAVAVSTPTATNTVGTGSTSGVNFADLGGFVNDLGSSISKIASSVEGPQFTRLPNGQVLLPNGQVLGASPILGGGQGTLLLFGGIALVVIIFMMSRGK